MQRDRSADGKFVYGVASTRIYCRPTCPSRRPRPDGIMYFATPIQAEAAGFRACYRCKPQNAAAPSTAWLAAVRGYIEEHADEKLSLAQLAKFAGVHATHLQRAFQASFGLSPRAYQDALRNRTLAHTLPAAQSVTTALFDAGYNSASRGYASLKASGIKPSVARKAAAGECIVFAIATTALGKLLAAATAKGVCRVAFADTSGSLTSELQHFRDAFHAADVLSLSARSIPSTHRDAAALLQEALPPLRAMAAGQQASAIPVDLRGTVFQQKIWRLLRRIPRGQTRSYSQLAAEAGQPSAARAVARACATNTVALAVPCHRVNATNGSLAGYRWGLERKRVLQAAETGAQPTGSLRQKPVNRGKSSASARRTNAILK